MAKPMIFISYSHEEESLKNRLLTHLGVLRQENLLDIWEDNRIGAGEDWYQKIQEAVTKASVAILLVSANFLTSKFIRSEEVPRLLERQAKEGLRIFPVIVKPCAWKQVKWLARMNLRPKEGRPISEGSEPQIDKDMAAIAEEIAGIIGHTGNVPGEEGFIPTEPPSIKFKFTVETLRDRQLIRPEDLPLIIEGCYSSNVRVHVWVVLQDSYGNYYLQYPEVMFLPNGRWVATNVNLGEGILFIHFVQAGNKGNAHFHQMVARKEWGAFRDLPQGNTILHSLRITRVA